MATGLTTVDGVVVLFAVALLAYSKVREWVSDEGDPIDTAKDAYASGEIDHDEFERRVAFHTDDRNERIRAAIEPINGVGPETSAAVADEFESVEAIRSADQEEIEAVHGVGESTAEAIMERLE